MGAFGKSLPPACPAAGVGSIRQPPTPTLCSVHQGTWRPISPSAAPLCHVGPPHGASPSSRGSCLAAHIWRPVERGWGAGLGGPEGSGAATTIICFSTGTPRRFHPRVGPPEAPSRTSAPATRAPRGRRLPASCPLPPHRAGPTRGGAVLRPRSAPSLLLLLLPQLPAAGRAGRGAAAVALRALRSPLFAAQRGAGGGR